MEKPKRTRSQIGKSARAKGMNAQNEFKRIVGGEVVPLSGAAGGDFSNDIHLWNTWQGEVKRFATGEKTLYQWLNDEREKPDFVAFRADRMPWVVSMHVDKFNRLLDVHRAAAELLLTLEDDLPAPHMYSEFMAAAERLRMTLTQSTRIAMQQAKLNVERSVNGNE
jgi:hypothetical protein